LGSGLDGLDEYGVVGGKIDEERRKNAQGNKRKMCHKTRRNSNENRIQKKNLLVDCVGVQSVDKFRIWG